MRESGNGTSCCGSLPATGAPPRRRFLKAAIAAGVSLGVVGVAKADDEKPGADERPKPGDQFVSLLGDQTSVVKIDDLAVGGPQIQAYPIDPKTGVVRDGSRLNLVILIRLDPAVLSEETRQRAAQGVLAYSGVCTHQGCPVSMWSTEFESPFCSCHGSVFDPKNAAEVLAGPAPRPLPALPLKIENGIPTVAASFTGRVGSEI
jgi:Rieske Fe-S protein